MWIKTCTMSKDKSQSTKMMAHEFHVLEVIARLPPLRATVFSSSSYDWAGVSLNVAEILIFGFQGSGSGMENYSFIYIKSVFASIFISIFKKTFRQNFQIFFLKIFLSLLNRWHIADCVTSYFRESAV